MINPSSKKEVTIGCRIQGPPLSWNFLASYRPSSLRGTSTPSSDAFVMSISTAILKHQHGKQSLKNNVLKSYLAKGMIRGMITF